MASMPPASGGISSGASAGLSFIASIGINYVFSRFTAQDGPRLKNLAAAGGDYGIPLARGYGNAVRATGAFIAQADIDEDKHKIGSKGVAAAAGAIGGAAQGFLIGGPVGAAVGAVAGGLLGFASPNQYYYTYSQLGALFILDRTDDDPCEDLLKIYAGGKLIFNSASATVTSEVFGTDGKLIKRKYKKNKYLNRLTFYAGHTEQGVDPDLAGESEISETAGYVYSSYVMMKLELEPWGNSFPATEFLVQVKSGETVASAVEQIARLANIDSTKDISTTALTTDTLRGYLVATESNCWDAIKPLLPAFAVDCADITGQIRFYKRSQTMRATIALDQMGSYVYGDSPPEQFLFSRATDLELPKETSLTFVDPERDYQPNTMTSRRTEGTAASNISTQIPLVMSANEGAGAAALLHWDAWLGRTSIQFTLTDSWVGLAVGLAYGIPVGDNTVPYRITRKTRGANGIVEVEAVSDESVVYQITAAGSSGLPPEEDNTQFDDTRLVLIDGPTTEDGHDDYGFYIAMAGTSADWPRGLVQASGDGGATWADIFDQPLGCVMGSVAIATPEGPTDGLDDTLDTTTVITVVLLHDGMVLEDATDAELDANANMFFLGADGFGEYIQFKTAAKIDTSTWELTNLRRGRRGTDWALGSHVVDEDFVMFGDGGVYRIVYSDTSQWGFPMKFRGITLHQDEDDAAIVDFTNTGEGKRPFSPINVEGSWDGSYNLTATFDSRSRLFAGGLGIDDNFEFDVEITNATPVRTMTVTVETFSYSAADQVTDGLVAGQVVQGRVRQTSDVNDGRWREFTLVGPLSRTADTTLFTADDTTITADMG